MTFSEENYLKAIYHLSQDFEEGVATNAIAAKMQTKASSVTDMVRKLADKGLLEYQKYQGASLSETGRQVAIEVVRKHRLWESFLVEKLNFSWDEVHEVAEQLEHIKSPKLIAELDKFLGYPTVDPHGDPIPDQDGVIHNAHQLRLSDGAKGKKYTCVGVKDTAPEFLQYLDKIDIALGRKIKVVAIEKFDHSMTIRIKKKDIVLSQQTTNNIYIKPL